MRHVQTQKKFGGLGILDLELFSRALHLRWLWLEWTDEERPWVGTSVPCVQLIDNSSEQVLRLQLVMVEKLLSGILPGLAAELQLILYLISTSWHGGKIER